MIAPGLTIIFTPIILGTIFGPKGVSGLIAGVILSGVIIALTFANSGGAWDNAKKYVESDKLLVAQEVSQAVVWGKWTEEHWAVIIADTVGDPLKDSCGPSLDILIKLTAMISFIFCNFFAKSREYILTFFNY